MADGLSIAASIIAVIQLTEKLTSWGYGYIGGVKRATKDRSELSEELRSLMVVLITLKDYADANPQSPALQELNIRQGIDGCVKELEDLKAKLEPRKGFMNMMDKLRWPFESNEIAQFRSRMNGHKALLNLALASDTSRGIQDLRIELADRKKKEEASQKGVKRKEVFNWLFSEDFEKRHIEISNKRQKDTGTWLLRAPEFREWKDGDPKFPLLWGFGIPGAGKTFLSSKVIDHFQEQPATKKIGLAYIYFEYTERDKQGPLYVLSSLVKQLATQITDLPKEIVELHKKLEDSGKVPKLEELYTALVATFGSFGVVFLIFDALDECGQESQRKVLLPLFHRLGVSGARLFVTSRQYPEDIQESFRDSAKIELSAKEQDIEVYIQQRIDETPQVKRLIEKAKCEAMIISELKNCAHGMFLLVRFHIEHLCEQTTGKQILNALERLKSSSIKERPLDPTYDRAMETLRGQPEGRVNLGLRVLSWLVGARRTLTVDELRVAVSIETGRYELDDLDLPDKTTVLDVCAGLVTVDEDKTIRLAHYTVQEYLLKKSHLPGNVDSVLATACITFLSFDIFTQRSCMSNEYFKANFKSYRFLDYAACQLEHHIRAYKQDLPTDIFLKFLKHPGSNTTYLQALGGYDYVGEHLPLHIASRFGHLRAAQLLLEKGADTSISDSNGRTALHLAAMNGNDAVVGLLLDKGADTSIPDSYGSTALHLAVWNGHNAVVGLLLDKGADTLILDSDGSTALHLAVLNGCGAMVGLLIDKGADTSIPDSYGKTALHLAARYVYDPVMVGLLLDKGADISISDSNGDTALHLAARTGCDAVVRLLLDKGADISISDSYGSTALHLAALYGRDAVVGLLLDKGADTSISDSDGSTALHLAACNEHDTVVGLLINKGADTSISDSDGSTALHLAALYGRDAVVRLLLDKGADTSISDSYGRTALHLAAQSGYDAVVGLLIDKGADTSISDSYGKTALHLAALYGRDAVVGLLLDKGADISISDSDGSIALHLAARNGHNAVVGLLLDKGADTSISGSYGRTALHIAAMCGHGAVVGLLLDKGADTSISDSDGRTALHLAIWYGYDAVVGLLLDKGADTSISDSYGSTALHLAVWNGHNAVVGLLLDKDADTLILGGTALHLAAAYGYDTSVESLLDKGADISAKDHTGYTPLHWAAGSRKYSVVRLLVTSAARSAIKENSESSAPSLTVHEIDKAVQQMLVENGVNSSVVGGFADAPRQAIVLPCAKQTNITCDGCKSLFIDLYYHCTICDKGDYDLCWDCVKNGAHCKDSTHYLFLIKEYGFIRS